MREADGRPQVLVTLPGAGAGARSTPTSPPDRGQALRGARLFRRRQAGLPGGPPLLGGGPRHLWRHLLDHARHHPALVSLARLPRGRRASWSAPISGTMPRPSASPRAARRSAPPPRSPDGEALHPGLWRARWRRRSRWPGRACRARGGAWAEWGVAHRRDAVSAAAGAGGAVPLRGQHLSWLPGWQEGAVLSAWAALEGLA